MITVARVLSALEAIAPTRLAYAWDRVGLQVGRPSAPVSRAVVALDRSRAALDECAALGAQLLISHHPLIMKPLETLTDGSYEAETALRFAEAGVALVVAHTNWDCARGGVNDALVHRLGLEPAGEFGSGGMPEWLRLSVFAPLSARDAVIEAAAKAGAGEIGQYRRCAFWSSGTGTFEPEAGANPSLGRVGAREETAEEEVTMRVPHHLRHAVEAAIRQAHPYEESLLDWLSLTPGVEVPVGRLGRTDETTLADFASQVEERLGLRPWIFGDPARGIRTVACVGGGADSEWRAAQQAGADVLVTGEVKHHIGLEASESGFALLAAGHAATEQPGVEWLRDRLADSIPEVAWTVI